MITPEAHAANYERENKQKTLTASELLALIAEIVAKGHGERPVFIMECDGLTHAVPIAMCFASEPYDGDVVWIIPDDGGSS